MDLQRCLEADIGDGSLDMEEEIGEEEDEEGDTPSSSFDLGADVAKGI